MTDDWYQPGQVVYQMFRTMSGWMCFSAEVAVEGTTLLLCEIDYKPMHTQSLPIGVLENLRLRRLIENLAHAEGYNRVVFSGVRIVRGRVNRDVRYERNA